MIRFRGRVWRDGIMHYDNMAAILMCQQAAYDYGMRDAAGIKAIDWRGHCSAEFMLWTGWMDALSTEVYEGDVVESGGGTCGVVRWRKEHCDFVISRWLGINRMDTKFHLDMRLEVIGNICEHSDFMQKVRIGGLPELPADLAALRL